MNANFLNNFYQVTLQAYSRALGSVFRRLEVYYNDYLAEQTFPDRKAKSGRLYYSKRNDTNKARTLYGNLARALQPNQTGNISELTFSDGEFIMTSGIDTDAKVKAGPDQVTLKYVQFVEEGTKRMRPRPFLEPGLRDFNNDDFPKVVDSVNAQLEKIYDGITVNA